MRNLVGHRSHVNGKRAKNLIKHNKNRWNFELKKWLFEYKKDRNK